MNKYKLPDLSGRSYIKIKGEEGYTNWGGCQMGRETSLVLSGTNEANGGSAAVSPEKKEVIV